MNKYILYRVGLASDEEENQAADQEAELVAVEYGGDLDDVLEDLLRDVRDDLAGMDENAGCDVEAHGPYENYDQPPFDFSISSTHVPNRNRTPARRQQFSRHFVTSLAFSESGNTLLPRSTFSGSPFSSKKRIVFAGGKACAAPIKNFSPRTTFSKNVSGLQSFVTLHLPFPVI